MYIYIYIYTLRQSNVVCCKNSHLVRCVPFRSVRQVQGFAIAMLNCRRVYRVYTFNQPRKNEEKHGDISRASFKYSLGRAPSRRSKIQFRRRTKCPSKGKCESSSLPELCSGSSGNKKSERSVLF